MVRMVGASRNTGAATEQGGWALSVGALESSKLKGMHELNDSDPEGHSRKLYFWQKTEGGLQERTLHFLN